MFRDSISGARTVPSTEFFIRGGIRVDTNKPLLLCEECRCIPKESKITLPSVLTVSLSHGGLRIEQEFALQKVVIPHGYSVGAQRAKKRIHFEFDAHERRGGLYDCFLILYDVVPYSGRDDWRSVKVEGQRLLVKQIRWKQWENQAKIVGPDEILPMMGVLLQRHFRGVGLDGFNTWLEHMTSPGQTPQGILVPDAERVSA